MNFEPTVFTAALRIHVLESIESTAKLIEETLQCEFHLPDSEYDDDDFRLRSRAFGVSILLSPLQPEKTSWGLYLSNSGNVIGSFQKLPNKIELGSYLRSLLGAKGIPTTEIDDQESSRIFEDKIALSGSIRFQTLVSSEEVLAFLDHRLKLDFKKTVDSYRWETESLGCKFQLEYDGTYCLTLVDEDVNSTKIDVNPFLYSVLSKYADFATISIGEGIPFEGYSGKKKDN